MVKFVVIWGAIAFGAAVLAGILAGIKNRDVSFWIGWSFVFPPMALFLLFMSKNTGPRPRQPRLDENDPDT